MFPAQALHVGGMAERGLGSFSVPSEAKAPHMTPGSPIPGPVLAPPSPMVGPGASEWGAWPSGSWAAPTRTSLWARTPLANHRPAQPEMSGSGTGDGLQRGQGGGPARQLRGVSGHLLCQRRGEQTTREPSAKPRLVTPDVR